MNDSDHRDRNRAVWNRDSDEYQDLHRDQLNKNPMAWGVWAVPESSVEALGPVAGRDILELGCGGGQWSLFLARAGGKPVGLDLSERQLAHARKLADEWGAEVPLVHADAEAIPFREASFDLVFCDHGAMSFSDPHRTVAEVSRVLRRGGRFVFNHASPFRDACFDADDDTVTPSLRSDYFELRRFADDDGVSFQLPYGEWIRLFRRHRLAVEDLIELRPGDASATTYETFVPKEWARRWPAENLWVLRRE